MKDNLKIPAPEETHIKVLAFDQGGIYIGVAYDATIKALQLLGATNPEALYTQEDQTTFIDEFECGKVSCDDFYAYMREHLEGLRADVTIQDLYNAWNAILTGVIPGVLEFIQSLKALGYITIVVSNADQIHQEGVVAQLSKAGVQDLFDHTAFNMKFISSEFGYNKPYTTIFTKVTKILQQHFPEDHIQPEEILFIDDSEKHIVGRNAEEGAENAKWQGLLVPSNLDSNTFKKLLLNRLLHDLS